VKKKFKIEVVLEDGKLFHYCKGCKESHELDEFRLFTYGDELSLVCHSRNHTGSGNYGILKVGWRKMK